MSGACFLPAANPKALTSISRTIRRVLVFALLRSVWLSVLALTVPGAADTVSMVIRIAFVQLTTPDEIRDRVGAVNFLLR